MYDDLGDFLKEHYDYLSDRICKLKGMNKMEDPNEVVDMDELTEIEMNDSPDPSDEKPKSDENKSAEVEPRTGAGSLD